MKEAPIGTIGTECTTTTTLSDATCTDITRMKCDIDSHTNSAIKPLRFGSNTNTSPESSSSSFSQGSPPYCFPASDGLPILEPLKIGLESDDEDDDSSLDSSCNDDDIDVPHPCIQPNINNCMEQRSRGSSLVNNFEYFHKESQGSTSAEEHVVSSIISTSTSCTSSLPPASSSTSCTSDTSSTLSSTTATNSTTSNANANADQPTPIPMHDNSTHSLPSLVGSDSLPNKRPRLNRYNGNRPTPTPRKKKGVTIHKSVAVVPIPSRLEYSSRMRERLWTASSDLASNAARNTIEFASEGWNWRNVIEDENMLVHQANGELIHPIHIHNALYCASQASSGEDINLNLSLLASIVPNSNSNSSASRPLLRSNEPAAAKPVQLDATQKSANDSNANPSHAVA